MAGFSANDAWRRMRIGSTEGGRASGRGGKAERPGLENHKRTTARAASRSTVVPGLVLILFFLIGCVQPSFQVQGPAQGVALKAPLASEVLMEVDDAGVKWGSGKVGDVLKTALVKNRTFGQVYYPIYPTRAIPNKLQIVARGDMEAESGAMGKAIVTGLLLFLPVGVLQYRE